MELSRLRAEVARLETGERNHKKSSGVLRAGCSVKYAWIDVHGKVFALTEMCAMLDVSISGYRAWKRGGTPGRKRLTDAQMLAVIRAIHAELKGAYGSPRMVRELRLRGFSAGKERMERLMRENGIRARHKRRYKVTTDSKHGLPVAENLLDRNFTPRAPNQVWTSDITYLWTDEGWLYLAIVLDLFNREVIGWSTQAAHDDRHCDRCVDDGLVSPAARAAGVHASFGPWQPIRQQCVSGQAQGIRHDLLDEPQR